MFNQSSHFTGLGQLNCRAYYNLKEQILYVESKYFIFIIKLKTMINIIKSYHAIISNRVILMV